MLYKAYINTRRHRPLATTRPNPWNRAIRSPKNWGENHINLRIAGSFRDKYLLIAAKFMKIVPLYRSLKVITVTRNETLKGREPIVMMFSFNTLVYTYIRHIHNM